MAPLGRKGFPLAASVMVDNAASPPVSLVPSPSAVQARLTLFSSPRMAQASPLKTLKEILSTVDLADLKLSLEHPAQGWIMIRTKGGRPKNRLNRDGLLYKLINSQSFTLNSDLETRQFSTDRCNSHCS